MCACNTQMIFYAQHWPNHILTLDLPLCARLQLTLDQRWCCSHVDLGLGSDSLKLCNATMRLHPEEKVIQTMPLSYDGGKAMLLGNKALVLSSKSAAS